MTNPTRIPKERLEVWAKEYALEQKKEKELQRMLSNDKYFEKYWEQDKIGQPGMMQDIAPIVRASAYKGQPLKRSQVIVGIGVRDDRYPVVMRGSKFCMEKKYDSKSGIFEDILERYFKFIKYSCKDPEKHRNTLYDIIERLRKRRWFPSRKIFDFRMPYEADGLWFLGEWISTYDDRYIGIIEKIDAGKANRIKSKIDDALRYEESRKKWAKMQETSEEYRKKKAKERTDAVELRVKLNRKHKAKQIAALELIQEMNDVRTNIA